MSARAGSIVIGCLLLVLSLPLAIASAPYFFAYLGLVPVLSVNFTAVIHQVLAAAVIGARPVSWVFAFSLTSRTGPLAFVISLSVAIAGFLLLAPTFAEGLFGTAFALMATLGLATCGLNLYSGTAVNRSALLLGLGASAAAAVLFGVWARRNSGPGLYYAAVKVETEPTMADIEDQTGEAWGRTGDIKSPDYPFVCRVLGPVRCASGGTSQNYTITVTKDGYAAKNHSWPADYRWKSPREARSNEAHIKVQLELKDGFGV